MVFTCGYMSVHSVVGTAQAGSDSGGWCCCRGKVPAHRRTYTSETSDIEALQTGWVQLTSTSTSTTGRCAGLNIASVPCPGRSNDGGASIF